MRGCKAFGRAVLLSGISVVALGAFSPAALAAPANAAAEQDATETAVPEGDIVVTARRKEERLSDVPVSVAALSDKALTERRIISEADLQQATPGLTVRQTNSSNQIAFSLRGQSLDAFSFAAPAVLTYFNEFNAQGVAASTFYDLGSIQVLKGPQGTLFGRNATGGAVLYSAQRPTDTFGGYAKVGMGNLNAHSAEGALNLPLGELGAFRVAAQYVKRDGYQRNLLLDTKNGSVDTFSIRPSLLLNLSDSIESYTIFQYVHSGGRSVGLKATNYYSVVGGQSFVNGQPYSGSLGFGLPSAVLYPDGIVNTSPNTVRSASKLLALGVTGLPSYINWAQNSGFYDTMNNQTSQHRGKQYTATNTTTFTASDSLTIKNVIGYNHARSRDQTDVDGTPFEPLLIGFASGTSAEGYTYTQKQFSEELQASGNTLDNKLKYIAGLYYFSGSDYQRMQLAFAPDYTFCALASCASFTPTGLGGFLREYTIKAKSLAAYAQISYGITDQLNLTVGGRYTSERTKLVPVRRTAGYDASQDDFNLGLPGFPAAAKLKASKPSWTVSLDYHPSRTLMFYLSHRGSWRTGGFNGTAATALAGGQFTANSFKPETTYDFEAGMKFNGELGSMPTTFNIAVYDQHIKNVIRAVYLGVAAVSGNVPKARVSGFEADASIRPASWLQIGGTLAYTDARYTGTPVTTVGNVGVTFGPYGDAPKWTGSAFARASYELPGDKGELALRGDYYGQSHYYYSNASATILPQTTIDAYHVIDGRLEWNKVMGSSVSVAGWVKNLTGEHYSMGGFPLGAVFAINATLPGLPRTYGVEASIKF